MMGLRFGPEVGNNAPRMRVVVFQRDGNIVLRMVVPQGAQAERLFPSMDAAFAAVPLLYSELTGEAA